MLWNSATKEDIVAAEMLPSWWVVFEVLKAQEKSHAKDKGDACPPPIAETQCSLKSEEIASLSLQPLAPPFISKRERGPLWSIGAFTAGYCLEDSEEDREEDPFDSGPIDPDKGPNLYPPDPNDNRVHLKQQALREGELDIAERIVSAVIYSGTWKQTAQWELLSFSVIKELQWTVTEHGISSPYFASFLDSVFAVHKMSPHDLRTLAQLLLTPTQYALWETEWEKGLQDLLISFVGHANQTLANLTTRQLMGMRPFTDPSS